METKEIELVFEIEQHLAKCLTKIRKFKLANKVQKNRKTQLKIVEEILLNAARPLHVKEIICMAAVNYQINLKRETIVSAITKRVKDGIVFVKTGKNEFGLISHQLNS